MNVRVSEGQTEPGALTTVRGAWAGMGSGRPLASSNSIATGAPVT